MKDLIEFVAKKIVRNPDAVSVTEEVDEEGHRDGRAGEHHRQALDDLIVAGE